MCTVGFNKLRCLRKRRRPVRGNKTSNSNNQGTQLTTPATLETDDRIYSNTNPNMIGNYNNDIDQVNLKID